MEGALNWKPLCDPGRVQTVWVCFPLGDTPSGCPRRGERCWPCPALCAADPRAVPLPLPQSTSAFLPLCGAFPPASPWSRHTAGNNWKIRIGLASCPRPLAPSLDRDQRSNLETAPEKTPQTKGPKHLLGTGSRGRLGFPLPSQPRQVASARFTEKIRDKEALVQGHRADQCLGQAPCSGRSWVNWLLACLGVTCLPLLLPLSLLSDAKMPLFKGHLLQEAFPQTSSHSPRKFLHAHPQGQAAGTQKSEKCLCGN